MNCCCCCNRAGSSGTNIDRVFITHLHADHVLGLPSLIIHCCTDPNERPFCVYGPQGLYNLVCASLKLTFAALRVMCIQYNTHMLRSVCLYEVDLLRVCL